MSEWLDNHPVVDAADQPLVDYWTAPPRQAPVEPAAPSNWLDRHPALTISPDAQRNISKLTEDYSRAVVSDKYDLDQLDEMRRKMSAKIDKLRRTGGEEQPPAPSKEEEFDSQVVEREGVKFIKDAQTGEPKVLHEPPKDPRPPEQIQMENKGKQDEINLKRLSNLEKTKNDLIKMQVGGQKEDGTPSTPPAQMQKSIDQVQQQIDQLQQEFAQQRHSEIQSIIDSAHQYPQPNTQPPEQVKMEALAKRDEYKNRFMEQRLKRGYDPEEVKRDADETFGTGKDPTQDMGASPRDNPNIQTAYQRLTEMAVRTGAKDETELENPQDKQEYEFWSRVFSHIAVGDPVPLKTPDETKHLAPGTPVVLPNGQKRRVKARNAG